MIFITIFALFLSTIAISMQQDVTPQEKVSGTQHSGWSKNPYNQMHLPSEHAGLKEALSNTPGINVMKTEPAKTEFPTLKEMGVKATANLVNQNLITIETAKKWLPTNLHQSLELELKRIQMEDVD